MNKEVNPETKQLLFDKGWRYELSYSYDPELGGTRVNHSLGEQRWNEGKNLTYVDITIAEVVMWLYEKYGIWISVHEENCRGYVGFDFNIVFVGDHETTVTQQEIQYKLLGETVFNSPTEAYEAAIEYTLNNLI